MFKQKRGWRRGKEDRQILVWVSYFLIPQIFYTCILFNVHVYQTDMPFVRISSMRPFNIMSALNEQQQQLHWPQLTMKSMFKELHFILKVYFCHSVQMRTLSMKLLLTWLTSKLTQMASKTRAAQEKQAALAWFPETQESPQVRPHHTHLQRELSTIKLKGWVGQKLNHSACEQSWQYLQSIGSECLALLG